MNDVIEITRELGRALQRDERYTKLHTVSEACDGDEELQNLIGEFNLKRMTMDNESHKEVRDEEKIQVLNAELQGLYNRVMQNKNMTAFHDAKQEMDALLRRVSAIISQSADGENPDTADYEESCGGSCATCGGCH